MRFPKWATPQRRACLVELWERHGLSCLQGHRLCPHVEHYAHERHKVTTVAVPVLQQCYTRDGNPREGMFVEGFAMEQVGVTTTELIDAYALHEREQVRYWVQDDCSERAAIRDMEKRRLHNSLKLTHRGQFDSIRREIFLGNRPLFEVVGIGVSGATHKRIAKIVIPGLLKTVLWVDLSGVKAEGSKNSRRKLARYKKGVAPQSVEAQITETCRRVAIAYLEKASRA